MSCNETFVAVFTSPPSEPDVKIPSMIKIQSVLMPQCKLYIKLELYIKFGTLILPQFRILTCAEYTPIHRGDHNPTSHWIKIWTKQNYSTKHHMGRGRWDEEEEGGGMNEQKNKTGLLPHQSSISICCDFWMQPDCLPVKEDSISGP